MDYAAIYATAEKDIPEWAKQHHEWEAVTDVTKLKKLEVKMKMCCNSCEEKVGEGISGMAGVFDYKIDKTNDLLTIAETPGDGPNHKKLLKILKKIDKKAEILKKPDGKQNNPDERENSTVIVVGMPNIMIPWNSPGVSTWPFFPNYNYFQHRVSCGHCLGYSDVVCGNCGRRSELGELGVKEE